jgi:hypothetical protein
MTRINSVHFLPVLLVVFLFMTSCSGPKAGGGCKVNCGGGGTATVSFTLVADTLPANPSILSFKVSINGVQITPTTGAALTLTPATPVIDLMRLQSDTVFLGALANVPAGTYTIQVSLSNPTVAFFNDTGATVTAGSTTCTNGSVCAATLSALGNPTIGSFTFTATSSGKQGIGLDFNLKNAISLSGGVLTVNFNPAAPSPGVLSAFALPRTNANLGAGQLELIEDFTGVVSISSNNVTITSPTRGALTAVNNSSSFFDASPDSKTCPAPATFTCIVAGQIASVDAYLNSDGTLSLKEFEPLVATQQDLVEGTVFSVTLGSSSQFGIVVTEKAPAATGSLIAGLNTGDLLTVNLSTSPPVNPFLVDTKGLAVAGSFASSYGLFNGATDTSAIHPGQTVSVHLTAFTAASGTTPASATVDTVTLRWSRFIATATGAASATQINVTALPSYFLLTPASIFQTAVFSGTLGADGITNLDGITTAGNLVSAQPVALRALFFENPQNSAQFPFIAAKIRQH